jgi:hypothetical protein
MLLTSQRTMRVPRGKPQISPLRYAPVEMTIHFEGEFRISKKGPQNCRSLGCARDDKGEGDASKESGYWKRGISSRHKFVISTGA